MNIMQFMTLRQLLTERATMKVNNFYRDIVVGKN